VPAATVTPRSAWVTAGLAALAAGGPDAVRIESLAADLGVTKGGFYGQFANRAMFLEALLDEWERRSLDDVLTQVEARGGDARTKIRRAGLLTFSADLLPVDLAIRDWARRDAGVAARLRRVDGGRMAYLRRLFATFVPDELEIEARSVLAFSLLVGSHFMAADHGSLGRGEVLDLAAELLLGPRAGTADSGDDGRPS
jgi:AcrR family transcriptional regulator